MSLSYFFKPHLKIKALSVLIALFHFCAFSQGTETNLSEWYGKGTNAYTQKNNDLAIRYFSKAIDEGANIPGPYYYRAWCYVSLGQYSNAIPDLNEAIALKSNYGDFYLLRAEIYLYDMQNYQRAVEDFSEAIKLKPSDLRGYIGLARAHYSEGSFNAALAACDAALLINSNSPDMYNIRASAYKSLNQMDLAMADCNKSVQLEPTNSESYCARADVLTAKGDVYSAITNYTFALRLDSENIDAYSGRGLLLFDTGSYSEGINDYTLLNPSEHSPRYWRIIGYGLSRCLGASIGLSGSAPLREVEINEKSNRFQPIFFTGLTGYRFTPLAFGQCGFDFFGGGGQGA